MSANRFNSAFLPIKVGLNSNNWKFTLTKKPSFQIQVNYCLLSLHTAGCQGSVYLLTTKHFRPTYKSCFFASTNLLLRSIVAIKLVDWFFFLPVISVFLYLIFFRKNNVTGYKTFLKGPLHVTESTELMTKIVIYGKIIIKASFFTTNEVHRSILICSPCLHDKCYR